MMNKEQYYEIQNKINERINELEELVIKAHKIGDWEFAEREEGKIKGLEESWKIITEVLGTYEVLR